MGANREWPTHIDTNATGRLMGAYKLPDGATVRRVGKKLAGRAIDGVVHDGFPAPPA